MLMMLVSLNVIMVTVEMTATLATPDPYHWLQNPLITIYNCCCCFLEVLCPLDKFATNSYDRESR